MATVAGVFNMVHTPFCYIPQEHWQDVRARRSLRRDVPEDGEEAFSKALRIREAFVTLRQQLAESRPDVIVIFGDDQREYLDFDAYPQFAVYADEEFTGALSRDDSLRYLSPENRSEAPKQTVKGYPRLAGAILAGLHTRDFDPAFCLNVDATAEVGHAFMRPAESVTDFDKPIVPIMLNCYFAPQVTAMRSYKLGRAVREVIDEYPDDIRVAVIGSGGLWHTPGAKDAYLDEEFDHQSLRFLECGDVKAAASFFDAYKVPNGDLSQPTGERNRTATGLPASSGPQGGTREFCNWIAAAAVADGSPEIIVDYVPVYSSPVGAGFAYWRPA
jgi:hypothetical protein